MEELPIAIRPATSDDYGYILKTWSVDFHKNYPTTHIPNSIYFPHQAQIINAIINQHGATVACIDDEPNTIVGYLVSQPVNDTNVIVHWAQTKGIFRRMGVLTTLLKNLEVQNKNIICTHAFPLFKDLKEKHHLIYDPTLLEDL